MKTIYSLILIILVSACAASKVAIAPVGTWDYSIKGTPNGDYLGDCIVALAEGKYSVRIKTKDGDIDLRDPQFDKAAKKLTGNFDYQGTTVFFESITNGDTMTGSLMAGGSSFPFNATRKK
jgi:hypothetical protein